MLTLAQQDSVPLSPASSPPGGFPGISRLWVSWLCLLSASAASPALTRRAPSSRLPGGSSQGQCDPALLGLKTHILVTTTPAAWKRQTDPGDPVLMGRGAEEGSRQVSGRASWRRRRLPGGCGGDSPGAGGQQPLVPWP